MRARGCPADCNELVEPGLVGPFRDYTQEPHCLCGATIPAGLSLHQDELYVVLDDRVGLIGLAKESGTILDLKRCVGDLVPDHGRKIVEPNVTPVLHDRAM